MAENNDLEVRLGADIAGFEAGMARADAAAQQFGNKVEKTLGEIDAKTQAVTAATAKHMEDLRRKYDPVHAAQQRYLRDLEGIKKAVELGAITEQTAQEAMQRAVAQRTQSIQRLIGANDALAVSQGRATTGARSMGATMQQAGFQVGDFAVQVASGQSAVVALTQQGTQLLQFFGPWGAALGAAGAVLGAFYVGLSDSADGLTDFERALKKTEDAVKAYTKAIEANEAILLTSDELSVARAKRQIEEAKRATQVAIAIETENYARAQNNLLRKEELEIAALASGAPGIDLGLGAARVEIQQIEDRVARLVNEFAQMELGNTGAALDEYLKSTTEELKRQGEAEKDRTANERDGIRENAREREKATKDAEKAERDRQKEILAGAKAEAVELNRWLDGQQEMLRGMGEAVEAQTAIERAEIKSREEAEKKAATFEAYLVTLEKENKYLALGADERRIQTELMEAQRRKGEELSEIERQRITAAVQVGNEYRRQKEVADFVSNSFERAFDRIGDAAAEMALEGENAFASLRNVGSAVAASLYSDFLKLSLLNPLKNMVFGGNAPTISGAGGLIGSFLGMFSSGASAGALAGSSVVSSGSGFVPVIHGGGIHGNDNLPQRHVSNDVFAGASRYHSGLLPNEFPAILQEGEGVFTRAQMAALGKRGSVNVEVIDQRGASAPSIEVQQTDGGVRLIVRDEIRKATPQIVEASAAKVADMNARSSAYLGR